MCTLLWRNACVFVEEARQKVGKLSRLSIFCEKLDWLSGRQVPFPPGFRRCGHNSMQILLRLYRLGLLFSCGISSGIVAAASPDPRVPSSGPRLFEDAQIRVRFHPRTPDQMAAFYEARGFPRPMVELLRGYCFITVSVRNKSKEIVWLDLSNWRFRSVVGPVERLHRRRWQPLWERMDIPLAARATFRWTLLPERLDLQPDEAEGGNIVLPQTEEPFTVEAHFKRGEQQHSGRTTLHVTGLRCAHDDTRDGATTQ